MAVPDITSYLDRLKALGRDPDAQGTTIDSQCLPSGQGASTVSIVTTSFNSVRTIERTIKSVLDQTFREIELIVVDGGSADGTVDVIRSYAARMSHWHSSRDFGISDAFNLGIAAARGKYVAIVNSDDWLSVDQIQQGVSVLERIDAGFSFGRLRVFDHSARLLHVIDGAPDYWSSGMCRMPHINHPTVLARRSCYDTVGLFDVALRVAMDYDWHLRAELAGVRGIYAPEVVGNMSVGGACDLNWQAGLAEVRDAAVRNGQSRVRARSEYFCRVARARARMLLTSILPKRITDAVHQFVNPRLSSGDG